MTTTQPTADPLLTALRRTLAQPHGAAELAGLIAAALMAHDTPYHREARKLFIQLEHDLHHIPSSKTVK